MLETDYKIIRHLVREYSVEEILLELQGALQEEANHLSDMGLKDKAISTLEAADILGDVRIAFSE